MYSKCTSQIGIGLHGSSLRIYRKGVTMGSEIQDLLKKVKDIFGYTNKDIAEILNISESSLISWNTGRREPRRKYVIELENILKIKNEKMLKGEQGMNIQADYIIDLQRKQIENQEKEILMLKSMIQDKPVEAKEWAEVEYDFATTVHIKYRLGKGFSRSIESFHGSFKHLEPLGYNEKEIIDKYYQLGKYFPMDKHPCDEILNKDSMGIIKNQTKTMPSLLNSLKNFYNTHYLTLPMVYQSKNRKIIKTSMCYLKILWSVDPIVVESKNKFVNN
tara:strand:+ start:1048 stop:1872 length:825 start_codon:yes stop_codon:yes gene_type:complete